MNFELAHVTTPPPHLTNYAACKIFRTEDNIFKCKLIFNLISAVSILRLLFGGGCGRIYKAQVLLQSTRMVAHCLSRPIQFQSHENCYLLWKSPSYSD